MTIRTEMLQTVSKARELLGDSAPAVVRFARGQLNPDGGFKGRSEQSDLYYTVFGLELLSALENEIPFKRIGGYLEKFDLQQLDLVHLASLVRCRVNLADLAGSQKIDEMKERVIVLFILAWCEANKFSVF